MMIKAEDMKFDNYKLSPDTIGIPSGNAIAAQRGVLTIEYQTDENTFSAIITITGIDGSMVMSESLPLSSGTRQLSLESLKAGSYLVQLMLNDKPAAIQRLQVIK